MNLCFPVAEDKGLDSTVLDSFSAASGYILYNSLNKICKFIKNEYSNFPRKAVCQLKDEDIDAVLVSNMGSGSLLNLMNLGLDIFHAFPGNIKDNIYYFESDMLPLYTLSDCYQRRS